MKHHIGYEQSQFIKLCYICAFHTSYQCSDGNKEYNSFFLTEINLLRYCMGWGANYFRFQIISVEPTIKKNLDAIS